MPQPELRLPWSVEKGVDEGVTIVVSNKACICVMEGNKHVGLDAKRNAEFLVHAANHHEEMRTLIRTAENLLTMVNCGHERPIGTGQFLDVARELLSKLQSFEKEQSK